MNESHVIWNGRHLPMTATIFSMNRVPDIASKKTRLLEGTLLFMRKSPLQQSEGEKHLHT